MLSCSPSAKQPIYAGQGASAVGEGAHGGDESEDDSAAMPTAIPKAVRVLGG
jgi:hypothetical protein